MKHPFRQVRYLLEYVLVLFFYTLLRILPRGGVRLLARCCGRGMGLIPGARKICEANIRIAFPDWDAKKVRQVARESLYHISLNFLESAWMSGIPRRVERVCAPSAEIVAQVRGYVERGVRIIFVNPHLGSWEASGLMAPYYSGVKMVAIAKPLKNPYLNKLLNRNSRERRTGCGSYSRAAR